MLSKLLKRKLSLLWLLSLTWGLESCVTIPNISTCAALPRISIGAGCTHNVSPDTSKLSTAEILDLLDAQPHDRTCVPVGQVLAVDGSIADQGVPACAADQSRGVPVTLAARGASIIIPSDDWGAFSIAVQEACRQLGSGCNYDQLAARIAIINQQVRIPQ